MTSRPSAAFVPRLTALLGERILREDVREALVAVGSPALDQLAATLADPSGPVLVRRHVAKAIAGFRSPEAGGYLVSALDRESDGLVRFSILRALGRLRSQRPDLVLEAEVLTRSLRRTVGDGLRLMGWRQALERMPAARAEGDTSARELLVALVRHKQLHAVERAFRLLDLLRPGDDLQRIHRGLESDSGDLRATSRELIEGLAEEPWLRGLLSSIDDLYETGSGSAALGDAPEAGDVETLRELLREGTESLAAIAAFHAGELGLVALVPELETLGARASPPLAEVVEQALAALGAGREQR
jgi:HEAT repeat protein